MTPRMSDEEKSTIHALYLDLIQQGKSKAEAYRELAATTERSVKSISGIIYRIENPDYQRKSSTTKKVVSGEFDPKQFIQHYQYLLEENQSLKNELTTLQKEYAELRQSIHSVLSKTRPKVKVDKDKETNNFHIVSVELTDPQKD